VRQSRANKRGSPSHQSSRPAFCGRLTSPYKGFPQKVKRISVRLRSRGAVHLLLSNVQSLTPLSTENRGITRMARTKLVRVAFVRYSPNGNSYPARCERQDIEVGDEVEVLMRANSEKAYYMNGTIDQIEFHRWQCTCRVECLVSEVEYFITEGGEYDRRINAPSARIYDATDWMAKKNGYYASLPQSASDEMRDIYEAAAGKDGDDAYLGDGVWITSDGKLEDRGH